MSRYKKECCKSIGNEIFLCLYSYNPNKYGQYPFPMTSTNLVEIFCILDEFCKYFTLEVKKHTLEVPGKCRRNRPQCMSDSEIMTIPVIFHTRHYRDLRSFCLCHVCRHMRNEFPKTVSYNRFVERQAQVALHLLLFLQTCALGKCTGISIIAPPCWYHVISDACICTEP